MNCLVQPKIPVGVQRPERLDLHPVKSMSLNRIYHLIPLTQPLMHRGGVLVIDIAYNARRGDFLCILRQQKSAGIHIRLPAHQANRLLVVEVVKQLIMMLHIRAFVGDSLKQRDKIISLGNQDCPHRLAGAPEEEDHVHGQALEFFLRFSSCEPGDRLLDGAEQMGNIVQIALP